MSNIVFKAGGVTLPSPTEISIDNEIIWSSDSGRDLSGLFAGDVIAEKKTVSAKWEYLTAAEVNVLETRLCAGYFQLQITDSGGTVTLSCYRGTLSKVMLGYIGDGTLYYKSASCKMVQR